MRHETTLITPPASEPVTVDDMCQLLGYGPLASLDSGTQTALTGRLTPLISAARQLCENWTRTAYLTQTWQMTMQQFPRSSMLHAPEGYSLSEIKLPRPPFQSVSLFTYVDTQGTTQTLTLDTSNGTALYGPYGDYQLSPGTETSPARVYPAYALPWPPTRIVAQAVIIQFVCGYTSVSAMPAAILQGIKFMAQFMYENGGVQDVTMPRLVCDLLSPYRNLN